MAVKFLVVRFSSIGDIVLTTPVVRCLKLQVEGAEVHFVTKKKFAQAIEGNPYIDKVHTLTDSLGFLINLLKKEQFDYIIDLHHNLRSLVLKAKLNAIAFSFNKINFQKALLVHFKLNRLPNKHIVDRYLETCSLFDITNDEKGLDFFISAENEVDISVFPKEFQNAYVAFAIGANHATKQLPHELAARLCNKINLPVMLLGGPAEREKAEQIIALCKSKVVINTCGNYNLGQSASLVKQAKVVLTHDTGLMHIAAAFKKNIVSVWGNTVPEFGMYPYMPGIKHAMFEVKNLSCRPCSKIGFKKCPKKHFNCMYNHNIEAVAACVNQYKT